MQKKLTIEIAGVEYEAQLATIKHTHLGKEDHGILSVNIHFAGVGGSWEQGTGHYFADTAEKMFPWVSAFIDFLGPWESIPGKEVYVLRESYSGPIVGLVHKTSDDYLMLKDIQAHVERLLALKTAAGV